jgi:hypothetical protein
LIVDGSIDWKAVAFVAPDKPVKVGDIVAATLVHFRIRESDFKGKSRRREVARARQVVMYLARKMTAASLPMIGREINGMDHTTVIWGARKIQKLIDADLEGMASNVKAIRELVMSGNPRAELRERDQKALHAAREAQAEREAEEAIRHSEQMAKLKRIKELADAGFLPTDREGRRM